MTPEFNIEKVVQLPVVDIIGRELPLGDYLYDSDTLISFVRHFGCISCAEYVSKLSPYINEIHSKGVNLLVVGNGKYKFIKEFIDARDLENKNITVLTDPTLALHQEFGLKKSIGSVVSPTSFKNSMRAFKEGFRNKFFRGSDFQQAGIVFLDKEKNVKYYFRSEAMGDNPLGEGVLKIVNDVLNE